MLLDAIYSILAFFVAIGVLLLLNNVIIITFIYLKFRKNLKGFPMMPNFSIFDGHLREMTFKNHSIHHAWNLVKKSRCKTIGFIYRDKPTILTHDLELIRRVIIDEKATNRVPLNSPFKEIEVDSIMLAQGEQWQRIRRVFGPALKGSKFRTPNVQREIESSIGKLLQAIEARFAKSGANIDQIVVNLDDAIHRYTLDLTLSCFYKQNNVISFDLERPDPMVEVVNNGMRALMSNPAIHLGTTFPLLGSIMHWLMMKFHPQGAWIRTILEFIAKQTRLNLEARKQVDRLKQMGSHVNEDSFRLDDGRVFSRNMIDHVIDQFHDAKLTRREYFNSCFFLVGASDKTSADGLIHTIYQLAINQQIQDRLRDSIRLDGLGSQYLAWVINESLRLLPPAPIGCSRMIERKLKLDDGRVIPANTFMFTLSYSIHRLEQYWGPDADQFRPERFAEADKFHPFQYLPFGAGPRMCPGREFALHEMKKLVCALLTRYSFHCEPMVNRYNAPFFIFVIPDKETVVKISRL